MPYDLFPTATDPLYVAIDNDRQFATLCRVLVDPEMGSRPEYRNNGERVRNRDTLRRELIALLADKDAHSLFRTLMDHGVPCAPVLTVEQSLQQQHTLDREMKVSLGRYQGIGIPVKLGRTPGSVRLPPPGIGEHTEETLARFGLEAERIAAPRDDNIIQ